MLSLLSWFKPMALLQGYLLCPRRPRRRWFWVGAVTVMMVTLVSLNTSAITVRVERGLAVRQLQGTVTVLRSRQATPARVNDRLSAVGDGLRTGRRSSAVLAVDTDVGFMDVSEQTELRIRTLAMAADGGRVTHITVPHGQVRLRLRPFTHRGSAFEIQTPAGISGVRGTEFGVTVQDDGKTGLATLSGAIETTGAGETVPVPGGFQTAVWPGEPPVSPVPLRNDPGLTYRREFFFDRANRMVALVGQVDPVNSVFVDGVNLAVDRQGQFRITRLATARLRLEVVVVTPLGRQETHEIQIL